MEKNAKIMGMDNVKRLIDEGRLRKRIRGSQWNDTWRGEKSRSLDPESA